MPRIEPGFHNSEERPNMTESCRVCDPKSEGVPTLLGRARIPGWPIPVETSVFSSRHDSLQPLDTAHRTQNGDSDVLTPLKLPVLREPSNLQVN